jgi:hypothetical protein
MELPPELASPKLFLQSLPVDADIVADGAEHVIDSRGERFRLHFDGPAPRSPAVILPLDRLLAVRVAAVLRLSRSLAGGNPGSNPAELSKSQRARHVLALRAIDGRQDGASYRAIGNALFGTDETSQRGWKTHDLRDRTIRLVRFGFEMMRDGYRRLLRFPYRHRN